MVLSQGAKICEYYILRPSDWLRENTAKNGIHIIFHLNSALENNSGKASFAISMNEILRGAAQDDITGG